MYAEVIRPSWPRNKPPNTARRGRGPRTSAYRAARAAAKSRSREKASQSKSGPSAVHGAGLPKK
eukprot:3440807-Pyramimonas_sp.AAC.1